MRIDFSITGEDTAALKVEELAARAADMRPALMRVRELLAAGEREQFASQGSFFGSRWPALADSTVAKKGSAEILVDTGKLRDSLTGVTSGRTSVGATSLSFGTDVWYARFAASGTTRGGEPSEPKRQIVGMPAAQLRAALQIIFRYLVEGLA